MENPHYNYLAGKGVEDAKLFILNRAYKHLEKPNFHVRLLFNDFSSAYNKMQPHLSIERLASFFVLPDQLLDVLTDRIRQVWVNGHTVCPAPRSQIWLLSYYVHRKCKGSSDNTTLLSLLQDLLLQESDHVPYLPLLNGASTTSSTVTYI